jgi:uncharacterized membrane protein YbaN (DUF454 family)
MSYHIGPNTELERGAAGGQPLSSLEENNSFPEQGKHRCILLLLVSLNIYFMYMIVHLSTGVGWNLVTLGLFPLQRYLVYPTMDLER